MVLSYIIKILQVGLDSNRGPPTCKVILTTGTPARDVIQRNEYLSYKGPARVQYIVVKQLQVGWKIKKKKCERVSKSGTYSYPIFG